MTEEHNKPEKHIPTTTRTYTVGYIRDSKKFQPSPSITLNGFWLAEAGFDTGTSVEVRVLPGCLILTAKEPQQPEEEPEIMQTLRKVCKFSARRQKQVKAFIEDVIAPKPPVR